MLNIYVLDHNYISIHRDDKKSVTKVHFNDMLVQEDYDWNFKQSPGALVGHLKRRCEADGKTYQMVKGKYNSGWEVNVNV